MAVPGAVQALIAAFSFGILFNAAVAALVLYVKGHGSAIYRDGLRLVLVLFLFTSSSWAFVEFLATLIDPSAKSTCQAAVVFSSLFDQLGRIFVEQYLVWATPKGDTKTVFSLVPQILVFGRVFVGIAFTAVTRTQFKPTCAPVSSKWAVAITVITLDAVILSLLTIQVFSGASARKTTVQNPAVSTRNVIFLVVAAVAVWWGTSVTSLLGLESIDLFYRTALPGIGLTVLVGLVTILSQALVVPRELPQRPDSPVSRGARDLSSSDSVEYPPSRYEEVKGANVVSISAFATKTEVGRSIRRNNDGTAPVISRPITAGADIGGNLTQEQLFSTVRPPGFTPSSIPVPPLPPNWGVTKSMSGSTRSRTKAGKLAISNPILNEDDMQRSFQRIPTIELADAASNDRLRRGQHTQRTSTLIAHRPAPRPPNFSAVPGVMIVKPRLSSELLRAESTKTTQTSSGLSVEGNASSTATQLSPGADAVRRRSPRQAIPATSVAPFRVIRPGEQIRIPIPRLPEQDTNLSPTTPEPLKTPRQRRTTAGLSSNPRTETLEPTTTETRHGKAQTVMLVNNIVYDQPDAVGDIMKGIAKMLQPPGSGDSVVNRPRPIPRQRDNDRQVFPAEVSSNNQHRRSKSGGSIVTRKSILQSVAGTPTGLPSLPPIPPMTTATTGNASSNNTNMTLEEKMNLLYFPPWTDPSSLVLGTKRRSSVPDLPRIAVNEDSRLREPIDNSSDLESNNGLKDFRASKRTTTRTSTLLGITARPQDINQDDYLVASADGHNSIDELGHSWLPGISFGIRKERSIDSRETQRRSSPILPTGRQPVTPEISSEVQSEDEETMTNSATVYSPAVPVSRQNARSTYIRKGSHDAAGHEEIPTSKFEESCENTTCHEQSSDSESDRSLSSNSDVSQYLPGHFHHRLGDGCPTFSARRNKSRPKRMPPPSPLFLDRQTVKRAFVVAPAQPSPVESPRAAYEAIQAQLRKFDQLDQDKMDSPNQRLARLADLEQEMGQLESQRQSNYHHLSRDSMSSIQTSPSRASRPTSTLRPFSISSSLRSSVASAIAERRVSRRARMDSRNSTVTLASPTQNPMYSSEKMTNATEQGLFPKTRTQCTEDASENLAHHPTLDILPKPKSDSKDPSLLIMNRSNSKGELNTNNRISHLSIRRPTVMIHRLWQQTLPTRASSETLLWTPPSKLSGETNWRHELPKLRARPRTQSHLKPLTIASTHLWQKISNQMPEQAPNGLWNGRCFSRRPRSMESPTRPVTIRPPRKNKRVTLLPDIIENPEPLPHKRDTLGIFQFPWGEKSEHATVQPRQDQRFMAMPRTMATRVPASNTLTNATINQLEGTEYSSSFFDEYDDEDGDNFSDFSSSGDDDFDETTVWEVVSPLQTERIPPQNGLSPTVWDASPSKDVSVLDEYMTDITYDNEHEDDNVIVMPISVGHIGAVDNQKSAEETAVPSLWAASRAPQNLKPLGLPQLVSLSWKKIASEPRYRTKSRSLPDSLEIDGETKLWSPVSVSEKAELTGESSISALWKDASESKKTCDPVKIAPTQHQAPKLWTKSRFELEFMTRPGFVGLPELDIQSWKTLVSQNTAIDRPRSRLRRTLPSKEMSTPRPQSKSKRAKLPKLWDWPEQFLIKDYEELRILESSRDDKRATSSTPVASSRASLQQTRFIELREAAAASYFESYAPRQRASPEDWDAALHQAILESDPEAIYLRGQILLYRSPVHESGLPSAQYLWSKPRDSRAVDANGLWALPERSDPSFNPVSRSLPGNGPIAHYHMRGSNTAYLSISLSEIEAVVKKQSLWKRGSVNGQMLHPSVLREKNWLDKCRKKRFAHSDRASY
ncbi:hypothetical protein F4777DRAFT_294097 [Nemania sp. FL0916]|nr:hypothetical protein F4777DRAFT_294097 [Nemania sp. FL0916]